MTASTSKLPLLIAVAFVVGGVVIAFANALIGGILAGLGVIPACWSAWAAMQSETQGPLVAAVGMIFVSLGTGGVLLVLTLVNSFS